MRRLAFLALTLATGCSDALEQKSSAGQVIGVVNANDRTLSVISATDFTVTTRSWQMGSATPRTIDGRGHVFVVPLGAADAVGVDLFFTCPPGALSLCVQPDYTLPLPTGSGATGVAIQDDSIAWIANPNLNTVTRVNYFSGDTTSVPVGVYPQAVALVGTRVFVVNSNLVGSTPAGPSWLTSFDWRRAHHGLHPAHGSERAVRDRGGRQHAVRRGVRTRGWGGWQAFHRRSRH